MTEARLVPFLTEPSSSSDAAADAGGAGALGRAGLGQPVDHRREHVELLGVLVLGEVVLARDRPQHVHRDLVRLADQGPELLRVVEIDGHQTSTAPSMTPTARRSRYHRSTGCSLTNPWPPSSWTPSRPIRMPWSAHSLAGERDLLGEVLAGGGAAGGLVGQQPHRLQLDRDVGDHERDRLAVGDRLAERLPLLDVRRHVVEHRLAGADRERAPGEPREPHALGVRRAVGGAEHGPLVDLHVGERQPGQRGGAHAHRRVALDAPAPRSRTRPGTAPACRRAGRRPRRARRRHRAGPATSRR